MRDDLDRIHKNHFNGLPLERGCGWTTYICHCIAGYLSVLHDETIPVVVYDERRMIVLLRTLLTITPEYGLSGNVKLVNRIAIVQNTANKIHFIFSYGSHKRFPYTWNENVYMELSKMHIIRINELYDDYVEPPHFSSMLTVDEMKRDELVSLKTFSKRISW